MHWLRLMLPAVELSDGYSETDVNLETLFEFVRQNPTIVKDLFGGR